MMRLTFNIHLIPQCVNFSHECDLMLPLPAESSLSNLKKSDFIFTCIFHYFTKISIPFFSFPVSWKHIFSFPVMKQHLLCICFLQHTLYGLFLNPPTRDALLFLEECCEDLRHSHFSVARRRTLIHLHHCVSEP